MKKEIADKMTVQELCDYAVEKLVQQGKRCMDHLGTCSYADGQGNHCAFGWILDHELHNWGTESGSVMAIKYNPVLSQLVPEPVKKVWEVFQNLQNFHDMSGQTSRIEYLNRLSEHIDTSNENYNKWLSIND